MASQRSGSGAKRGGSQKSKNGAPKRTPFARTMRAVACALALLVLLSAGAYFANRYLEKRTYRLVYAEEILACAAQYELDPYLVAAVIHCESGGDRNACSPKGALGLMQIMPATGEWIAGKLDWTNYSDERLTDARDNISLGCWYLSYLLNRYDGDARLALAAYNAGPGNVSKWLDDPAYSENGALTTIPFAETEAYVRRVSAASAKYKELYESELG